MIEPKIKYTAVECERCSGKAEHAVIKEGKEIRRYWNCYVCGWHYKSKQVIPDKSAPAIALIPLDYPSYSAPADTKTEKHKYTNFTGMPTPKPKTSVYPEPADPVNPTATGPQTTPKPVSTSAADAVVWTVDANGKMHMSYCLDCGETKNLSVFVWNPTKATSWNPTKYTVNCLTCGRVWDVDKPLAFSPKARTVPVVTYTADAVVWTARYNGALVMQSCMDCGGTKYTIKYRFDPTKYTSRYTINCHVCGRVWDLDALDPIFRVRGDSVGIPVKWTSTDGSIKYTKEGESPYREPPYDCPIDKGSDSPTAGTETEPLSAEPVISHGLLYGQLSSQLSGSQIYNYIMASTFSTRSCSLLFTPSQLDKLRLEIQSRLDTARQIDKDKRDNRLEIIRKLFEDKE